MKEYWELKEKPVFVPYQRQKGYRMKEMANVPVEQYHQSNDKDSEYHKSIDTIHAVKELPWMRYFYSYHLIAEDKVFR